MHDSLSTLYFDWLCECIRPSDGYSSTQIDIVNGLYSYEYTYNLSMDSNRYSDGQFLIYRFADENDIDRETISDFFEPKGCTVLEMMVALAIRCEDVFTYDVAYGNRTSIWFWEMCTSLGLFESNNIEFIIDRFLRGNYSADGAGGLFTIPGCTYDLRDIDIWTQLCWWLAYRDI